MLISFYKEPGFGFKTVIGSYLDASCYVPTFLTVYSTFHNDYEVMILLFTFLIHYCYNSRNILTTFSIIEKNNLLYPLVQNAREHNELVEKDETLKQLESDYHQQRVAFLRHLILYRPYQYVSLSVVRWLEPPAAWTYTCLCLLSSSSLSPPYQISPSGPYTYDSFSIVDFLGSLSSSTAGLLSFDVLL